MNLVDQPSALPTRKLQYGGAAGLLAWLATEVWGAGNVPAMVDELIPWAATIVGVYMTRENGPDAPDHTALVKAAVREAMAGVTIAVQGRCAESARCKLHAGHDGDCEFGAPIQPESATGAGQP